MQVSQLFSASFALQYERAPDNCMLMNVAYVTRVPPASAFNPGGPLGTYWPLPHSQRQPSGPTAPVYGSGPQTRVGPLQ